LTKGSLELNDTARQTQGLRVPSLQISQHSGASFDEQKKSENLFLSIATPTN